MGRLLRLLAKLLTALDTPKRASAYRVIRVRGGFSPQMSYSAGMTGTLFWTPLDEMGYWIDPHSFGSGVVTEPERAMTRSDALTAIERARCINTNGKVLSIAGVEATMAADLKPCPFCGSEPWGIFGPTADFGKWWVECHGPDDNTCCGDWYCTVDSDDRETARAEVAEAWNRRATSRATGIPAGYVLVPLEPTPAMFAVDAPEDERPDDFGTMKYRRGIWKAMLRASSVEGKS